MCDECKCHEHGKGIFSRVHSNLYKELKHETVHVSDDENLTIKKDAYSKNPTFENLLALAGAYSFQLRYTEALALYEHAVEMNPTYLARRKRAITYLKLLLLDEAYLEFLWCKEHTDDLLDVEYRLGLCKYYSHEYTLALKHFEACFDLARENPDMYISVLYWYYLCLSRLKKPFDSFKEYRKFYKNNFYTHPGYDLFVRFACGEIDLDDFEYEADTLSALQQTCAYYGMSVYYEDKEERRSKRYKHLTLSLEDYFGGFAYLACYSDENK